MSWKRAFFVLLVCVAVQVLVDPLQWNGASFYSSSSSPTEGPQLPKETVPVDFPFVREEHKLAVRTHNTTLITPTPIQQYIQYFKEKLGSNLFYALCIFLLVSPWTMPPVYQKLFVPLVLVKTLEQVEKDVEGDAWRGARQRRVRGDIPPPYPNSWFKVLNSRDLQRGEAKDIELLGQYLVVFRGKDDGKVRILDAYCPHMGANLGVMGQVVGNEIMCPFHGWQFDGDGQCTKIPYANKVPAFIKTTAWPIIEVNEAIYLWHDAEGRPPSWYPPEIPDLKDGKTIWHGASSHQVRAHIQDIPENGPDFAHLNVLHVPFAFDFAWLRKLLTHSWDASWVAGEGIDSHLAFISVKQHLRFLGHRIPGTFTQVDITQVGPSTVHLCINSLLGRIFIHETVTPVQPLLQHATHQCWADRHIPRWMVKIVFQSMLNQFERDVPIWNNKMFLASPVLVKEDGPIGKYRRWFAKNFYSENSRTIAELRKAQSSGAVLDW